MASLYYRFNCTAAFLALMCLVAFIIMYTKDIISHSNFIFLIIIGSIVFSGLCVMSCIALSFEMRRQTIAPILTPPAPPPPPPPPAPPAPKCFPQKDIDITIERDQYIVIGNDDTSFVIIVNPSFETMR
jgi:hypothetical protein